MTLHHTYIYTEGGHTVLVCESVATVKSKLIDAQRESDWAEFLVDEKSGDVFYIKPFSVVALESTIESPHD